MEESLASYRFGVITVSDTRTEETDKSGPAIEEALHTLGAVQVERSLVHDDVKEIQAAIMEMAHRCNAVFTTGGTGFGPRDVTPEATASLLERPAEGIPELLRFEGSKQTPMAWLSRGVAGVVGSALVINLPGAPSGARQGIDSLAGILPHILDQLAGGGHSA